MIERRRFLGLAAIGLPSLFAAEDASACQLVPTITSPFSDTRSRGALARFVALLNDAHALSDDDLIMRKDELGVELESAWVNEVAGNQWVRSLSGDYLFFKEFRVSAGRLDPRPIVIEDINLLRRIGDRATYQFTLKRYAYHPADPEGCNGLFVHDEFYGFERIACAAALSANRLQSIRRFPEWVLDDRHRA